jgi:hypothetical protein
MGETGAAAKAAPDDGRPHPAGGLTSVLAPGVLAPGVVALGVVMPRPRRSRLAAKRVALG